MLLLRNTQFIRDIFLKKNCLESICKFFLLIQELLIKFAPSFDARKSIKLMRTKNPEIIFKNLRKKKKNPHHLSTFMYLIPTFIIIFSF